MLAAYYSHGNPTIMRLLVAIAVVSMVFAIVYLLGRKD